jgi:hypothetical protein
MYRVHLQNPISHFADAAMPQPHHNHSSVDENSPEYILKLVTVQPDNSFYDLGSYIAATESYMQLLADFPMGGTAIGSSSLPVPYSDSNKNDITSSTSIETMGLVNGTAIVECVVMVGG